MTDIKSISERANEAGEIARAVAQGIIAECRAHGFGPGVAAGVAEAAYAQVMAWCIPPELQGAMLDGAPARIKETISESRLAPSS